jgi:hypothetical protein
MACLARTAHADELTAYTGQLFGEALTGAPVSGTFPRLADHRNYGVRFDHSLGPLWGVELTGEQTRTYTARRVQSGVSEVHLRAAELDVRWNFTQGSPIVGYTLMGAGYARARLDPGVSGILDGLPVRIEGRGSPTANLGIGARAYATRHLFLRVELRYRFLGYIVEPGGRALSTVEGTAGLGWRF